MKQSTYLILENRTRHDWSPEFAVLGCRKTKPALGKQQVAIRLNITLPDKTFDEFIPEAEIGEPEEE